MGPGVKTQIFITRKSPTVAYNTQWWLKTLQGESVKISSFKVCFFILFYHKKVKTYKVWRAVLYNTVTTFINTLGIFLICIDIMQIVQSLNEVSYPRKEKYIHVFIFMIISCDTYLFLINSFLMLFAVLSAFTSSPLYLKGHSKCQNETLKGQCDTFNTLGFGYLQKNKMLIRVWWHTLFW